jgi:hypothetical protein
MTRAVVAAALAALSISACGSSSLSMKQLQADASRPCRIADRRLNRIATPAAPTGEAEFLKRGIAALAPELRSLRDLRPPHNLSEDFADALGASSQVLAALRESAHRLATGDDPVVSIKTLEVRLAPLEAKANSAWASLGVSACLSR